MVIISEMTYKNNWHSAYALVSCEPQGAVCIVVAAGSVTFEVDGSIDVMYVPVLCLYQL
jgi:hypothetical protein